MRLIISFEAELDSVFNGTLVTLNKSGGRIIYKFQPSNYIYIYFQISEESKIFLLKIDDYSSSKCMIYIMIHNKKKT